MDRIGAPGTLLFIKSDASISIDVALIASACVGRWMLVGRTRLNRTITLRALGVNRRIMCARPGLMAGRRFVKGRCHSSDLHRTDSRASEYPPQIAGSMVLLAARFRSNQNC
jgi:hypothetical protein